MADAVIMDDNGGVRGNKNPALWMRIRRENPEGTQIPMDELTDPAKLEHPIPLVRRLNVTATVDGREVLPPTSAKNVIVTGPGNTHVPHDVTFTVEKTGPGDILVSSIETLVKLTPPVYKTGKDAKIRKIIVDGKPTSIPARGVTVVTVTCT